MVIALATALLCLSQFALASGMGNDLRSKTTLTTKGDLETIINGQRARVGIGTDGQVLSADSAQPGGFRWATPGTGSGTVTNSGALTSNAVIIGQGTTVVAAISADTTAGHYLRSTSTSPAFSLIPSYDIAGTHAVAQGGTGITTGTANGVVYMANAGLMTTTTADTTATHALFATATAPAWRQIISSDIASGVFGPNSGGTGYSSFTKGDILTSTGTTNLTKLGVGTDGQVLSADSSTSTGLKWITLPTSGGGTPGGSVLGVQINNSGSFNSIPLVTGDTSRSRLAIGPLTSNLVSLDVAGPIRSIPFTITDAANVTPDASASSFFIWTLGGNRTLFAPANGVIGERVIFLISQDSSGGRKLAFGGNIKFGTDVSSYDSSTTAGRNDYIGMVNQGVSWDVVSISKNYA